MQKLTETFTKKVPPAKSGTEKYWDAELKGLVLFVGKKSKTWYFQKDVGGQTQRKLIGRYPLISAQAARQTAMGFALEMGRGAGRQIQMGAPILEEALEAYLARPKLRSEAHKSGMRQQFDLHLKDWLRLPLDEISKSMVVQRHVSLSSKPSAANHLLKYFRTVWNHARRTDDLPESPTMAIEWFTGQRYAKPSLDALRAFDGPIFLVFFHRNFICQTDAHVVRSRVLIDIDTD